jgi:hypothetical protein
MSLVVNTLGAGSSIGSISGRSKLVIVQNHTCGFEKTRALAVKMVRNPDFESGFYSLKLL